MTQFPTAPPASTPGVRAVMQGNRSKDTRPELALRRELHRRGLRFRKHLAPIPGYRFRADIVFTRQRVAVDCLGCFWHGCPVDGIRPKTNASYWRAKLDRNTNRDIRNAKVLAEAGWALLFVWEHEDVRLAADRIESVVRALDR